MCRFSLSQFYNFQYHQFMIEVILTHLKMDFKRLSIVVEALIT